MNDPLEIASVCNEFESMGSAQGFGISFLNSFRDSENRRCDNCINWEGGNCPIYILTNNLP